MGRLGFVPPTLFLLMDDFNTLSNRLLTRCPMVGMVLAQQFINDSWRTLQSHKEWSFRRRSGTFAPPDLYQSGSASTNVENGNPNLITGSGTTWTPAMVGRQIRVGGLNYPYYTIIGWQSPTALLIDQPWAGADLANYPYQILQTLYPVPEDFGYFYAVVSVKDAFRLWTNVTEADLAIMDPQRANYGQTYAVAFKDYVPQLGGIIGGVIPVSNPDSPCPVSTSTTGFTYVAPTTYVIQVVQGGVSGTATFKWLRAGQAAFGPEIPTTNYAQDLTDGVQIYWPDDLVYIAGDLYTINAYPQWTQSVPRYELWPGPAISKYLYPYIYIAKETDVTVTNPKLPPFIANRGEVLLEMGLQKAAEYPGPDAETINPYYNLKQAAYHQAKVLDMLVDLERNDEEVGVSNVDYQMYPMAPAPWLTGQWQQTHAPYLIG